MNTVIETDNLTRRFGDVTAVDHLSLSVGRGEIYAFLGLNGAGKTTTTRMLLGMVKPDNGHAVILGERIRGAKGPWASIGYLVEKPSAYPELTVWQNLDVVRRLRPGTSRKSIERVIDLLSLGVYADRRAGALSLGNLQRLGLAKALMHDPELLILDEPSNGLDPAGIVEIRNLMLTLSQDKGVTIFMSSHILGEVSRLAGRIGVIHHGRLVQELSTEEIDRLHRKKLVVCARDNDAAHAVLKQAGYNALLADGCIELEDPSAADHADDIAVRLVRAEHPPVRLEIHQEDLETYFLRLIGEKEGGQT